MNVQAPDHKEKEKLWHALTAHHARIANRRLSDFFSDDDNRFSRFSIDACGLLSDFSKHRIDNKGLQLLCKLADASRLKDNIDALFSGKCVNYTEQRPALHTALREHPHSQLQIDGELIMPAIHKMQERMTNIVQQLQTKQWLGVTAQPITDVVHIGIGGSNLGPRLAVEALAAYKNPAAPRCHFIANMDIADSLATLEPLDPATTLCIIASKSFTTRETLENQATVIDWFLRAFASSDVSPHTRHEIMKHHIIGITTNKDKALTQGIPEENILTFPVWVGGRYSLWSSVGLIIAIAVGMANFKAFLQGARDMDTHFRTAPFDRSIPVISALLSIWYSDFFGAQTQAILPYMHALRRLPTYLQQLEMESNGKYRRRDGSAVTHPSGNIIWGGVGSNSQHAFHQLLFQGSHLVPADFIVAMTSEWADKIAAARQRQLLLVANCFSQSHALMYGKSYTEIYEQLLAEGLSKTEAEALAPHKVVPGNQPSTTFLMPKLTPYTLGALLATYEHKTFVQSVIWGTNPFDQWGVELGKQQSATIIEHLEKRITDESRKKSFGASTQGLIDYFHDCTDNDKKTDA